MKAKTRTKKTAYHEISNDQEYRIVDDPRYIGLQCINPKTDYTVCGTPLDTSDPDHIYMDLRKGHVLIVGSTGSGKSRRYFIPHILLKSKCGHSMIINDPKGELYNYTAGTLAQNGYKIWSFNTREPQISDCWPIFYPAFELYKSEDPLKQCKAREIIHSIASTVCPIQGKEAFWYISGQNVFDGGAELLMAYKDDPSDINFNNIMEYIEKIVESPQSRYEFNHEGSINSICHQKLAPTVNTSEITQRSIIGTLTNCVAPYITSPPIQHITSNEGIRFEDLIGGKVAIFLITPDENETYNPLVSVFVETAYEYLIRRAYDYGGSLPVDIHFILDEFGLMTYIPSMSRMLSAGRSRNIWFNLSVQSMDQILSVHGMDAESIKGNCSTWIFFRSRSLSTLTEISLLCGDDEYGRSRYSVTDLQSLRNDLGEVLIMRQGVMPYIGCLKDFTSIDCFSTIPEPPIKEPIDFSAIIKKDARNEAMESPNAKILTDLSNLLTALGHGGGISKDMEGSCDHLIGLLGNVNTGMDLLSIIDDILNEDDPKELHQRMSWMYDGLDNNYASFQSVYTEIRNAFKFRKNSR